MKKRLLASILSLAMVFSLVPVSALAEDEEPGGAVCTCEALCAEGTVNEDCPVCAKNYALCEYVVLADEGEPVPCTLTEGCTLEAGHEGECTVLPDKTEPENDPDIQIGGGDVSEPVAPVCMELAGFVDGAHDPECPLYMEVKDPIEEPVKPDLTYSPLIDGQVSVSTEEALVQALSKATTATTIQITAPIVLTKGITISQKTIILTGEKISLAESYPQSSQMEPIFTLDNSSVTLYSEIDASNIARTIFKLTDSSSLVMEAGSVLTGTKNGNSSDAPIYLAGTNCKLQLDNGTIKDNQTWRGAVYLTGQSSEVVMNGGEIKDNTSVARAGGISATTGTLRLYGGEISGNYSTYPQLRGAHGDGVYVNYAVKLYVSGSIKIINNQTPSTSDAPYAPRNIHLEGGYNGSNRTGYHASLIIDKEFIGKIGKIQAKVGMIVIKGTDDYTLKQSDIDCFEKPTAPSTYWFDEENNYVRIGTIIENEEQLRQRVNADNNSSVAGDYRWGDVYQLLLLENDIKLTKQLTICHNGSATNMARLLDIYSSDPNTVRRITSDSDSNFVVQGNSKINLNNVIVNQVKIAASDFPKLDVDGHIFAGWYDNESLIGNAVTTPPQIKSTTPNGQAPSPLTPTAALAPTWPLRRLPRPTPARN